MDCDNNLEISHKSQQTIFNNNKPSMGEKPDETTN